MSLRARLLAGLLVLAAAGLLTLAAITYAEQRSFLYERVDSQLSAARFPVSTKLDQSGANVPGYSSGQSQPPGGFGGDRDDHGPLGHSEVPCRPAGRAHRDRGLGGVVAPIPRARVSHARSTGHHARRDPSARGQPDAEPAPAGPRIGDRRRTARPRRAGLVGRPPRSPPARPHGRDG